MYALGGATRVTAAKIDTYDTGEENTGKLVVSLPTDPALREKIFAWCAEWADRQGFDPERDTGQEQVAVEGVSRRRGHQPSKGSAVEGVRDDY